MPPLLILSILAIVAAVPLLGWSVVGHRAPGRTQIQQNLIRGLTNETKVKQRNGSWLETIAGRFTPDRLVAKLDRRLALAGRPAGWPLRRVVTAKILLALAAAVLGILYVSGAPGARSVLLAVALTAIAYFVPDLLVYSKGTERQAAIALELPDTLDQMTIAVEAGLGFDSAMARAGQNGKGPLSAEMVRTLQDMQLGMARREAYAALLSRTNAPDLRKFVNAIVQADRYGISISSVLRVQASEMRMKRRQRAEEKAMQIPVKVLFPLMVCILPVLFIVVLGPAAIKLMETLG
ncbi:MULTISPECIES: type II secretion system F family protein [unclassified Arthrobacter]|uniref:type II secretion system F family protein n=1 Tax=unclassified Arthrobacter TaxID=235627 RepID=UPI001492902D|nr:MULTISPECIES: type II secretion system F family protein [unclassified Arthrobacter]MBE0008808.1 type II secretion system F family protein [Arthrobacter sp. AET 35A]NOJ62712.1 type II secretion system F family protein [Arthrobacter sp. 147(2020)]